MIREKYLLVGHMWWCSLVVGEGMREAEVVGSNPSNAEKNRTRAYSRKKYFLVFIPAANIYFST